MKVYRMTKISIIGFGFLIIVAGCQTQTPTGTVIGAQPPWLFNFPQYAPRINLQRPDGSVAKLRKVGGPFFVIGFISPPGDDPGYISPALQKMANDFWLDSIDVIQITLPTDRCPLTPETIANCQPPVKNLHRFFDPEKLAWRGYHKPKSGTILLINRRNLIPIIDTRGTIEKPGWVIYQAEQLQIDWEHEQQPFGKP